MKRLHLSEDLSLPLDIATSTAAIIAIRGAGKSYTAAVLAEELIEAEVQTVIVDPTGAWWGLRSSADGKSAGLSVVVMGGNHGDVPLEESAGEVVAEFVVESGASVVLDLSLMRKNAQKRFMAEFAESLYHLKAKTQHQTPLHLILDEADRFAPQRPQPEHARLLGAIEDIVRLGRSRGFGFTAITQRAAVLNKDVLTQIETLIVLRTTSPQDRKAMKEWVQENADEATFETLSSQLSSLPNGTAWVWSPSVLQMLKRVKIRTRRTFNSSATPKVGEKRIEPKVLAAVDLDALKGRIASTIEKAKANDPKALKARIAELERATNIVPNERIVEVPAIADEDIKRFEDAAKTVDKATADLHDVAFKIIQLLGSIGKRTGLVTREVRSPFASIAARSMKAAIDQARAEEMTPAQIKSGLAATEPGGLKAGARAILSLLVARYPNGMSRSQVATLTGIKPGGSTFVTYIGQLRRLGLVDESGSDYIATMAGVQKAGWQPKPPTGRDEVLALWSPKLKAGARAILETVVKEGPVGRDDLGAKLGINPDGSTFVTYVGILRRNGLIVTDGNIISANGEVFA